MDESTSPIIIESNGKSYRIANVTLGPDGSLYFSFPKKGGYNVEKHSSDKYTDKDGVKTTVHMNAVTEVLPYPKVSFHPSKQTVHIKTSDGKRIGGEEYELYNFSSNPYEFICPVMQVVLSGNLACFEEFNKKKYKYACRIEDRRRRTDGSISLFFYVHSTQAKPDIKFISGGDTKFIWYATMNTNAPFTFSIFYGELEKGSLEEGLLLLLNTRNRRVTMTLV